MDNLPPGENKQQLCERNKENRHGQPSQYRPTEIQWRGGRVGCPRADTRGLIPHKTVSALGWPISSLSAVNCRQTSRFVIFLLQYSDMQIFI